MRLIYIAKSLISVIMSCARGEGGVDDLSKTNT